MRFLKDTGLLILYCFLILFHYSPNAFFILAFLTTLILCCCDYLLDLSKLIFPLCLVYLLLAFFIPPFLYFFPPWAYVFIRRKCNAGLIACTALYLFSFTVRQRDDYILFIGLLGLLIAFILLNNSEAYEKLEALYKQTRDDSAERNILLTEKNHGLLEKQNYEIYTATLQERNRIAREIHDNVGHLLSRSILLVGALRLSRLESTLTDSLITLDTTLNSAMDNIRNSVHDLHDESINLEAAVKSLLKDFSLCPVSLDYDMGQNIPRDVKYSFISITKEALFNAMKHSNATHINILLREHPALYQLCIEDNGTLKHPYSSGIGLINMKDRVSSLKGHIQITAEEGFKIFITIPKEA